MPYTGVKNIDQTLTEFYCEQFKEQHGVSPAGNPKAQLKIRDAVEKQRKVLSANTEHQLNLEYLLQDEDLSIP